MSFWKCVAFILQTLIGSLPVLIVTDGDKISKLLSRLMRSGR